MHRKLGVALALSSLLGCTGTKDVNVTGLEQPVAVTGVAAPIAVSGVAQPVAVSAIGAPVAISAIVSPVAISSIATPVAIASPDLDPARIETGNVSSPGYAGGFKYFELVAGPFVLTDAYVTNDGTLYVTTPPATGSPRRWSLSVTGRNLSGARLGIRAGESLFFETVDGSVTWSGFRP
jgi:hypothetical protein